MTTTVTTMHAVTVTCDRCGRENKSTDPSEQAARARSWENWGYMEPTFVHSIGQLNGRPTITKKAMFDPKSLCPSCLTSLTEWMENT